MAQLESTLEMAERHVREGERIVCRQRQIVEQLLQQGHPILLATELLMEFELALDDHRSHLAKLIDASDRRNKA